jgi:hypothetical protein
MGKATEVVARGETATGRPRSADHPTLSPRLPLPNKDPIKSYQPWGWTKTQHKYGKGKA